MPGFRKHVFDWRVLPSLVSLHDGVRNEPSRDLLAAEPAAIQTVNGLLRRLDRLKLDIDFALSEKRSTTSTRATMAP